MGLFHDTSDPLHGVTVVVESDGPEMWVGRCNRVEDDRILLFENDCYVEGETPGSKEEWLRRTAMVGFHPRQPTLEVARERVKSVRPLIEYGN